MRALMTAGLALCGLCTAWMGTARAVDYPWCVMGETRGFECSFMTKDQCAQDGRGRGFGGQCIQNPFYKGPSPRQVGPNVQPQSERVRGARASAAERTAPPGGPSISRFNRYNGTDPDAHIRSQLQRDDYIR